MDSRTLDLIAAAARDGGAVEAALSVGTDAAGGHLVSGPGVAGEGLTLADGPSSWLFGPHGPTILRFSTGESRRLATATAASGGVTDTAEGAVSPERDMTVGATTLAFATMRPQVVVSRELLTDAPAVEQLVRETLLAEIHERLEDRVVNAAGGLLAAAASPVGADVTMGIVGTFSAAAGTIPGVTAATVRRAARNALARLPDRVRARPDLTWLFSPRWYDAIMGMSTSSGRPAFGDDNGSFMGLPASLTTAGKALPARSSDDGVVGFGVGVVRQAVALALVDDVGVFVDAASLRNVGQVRMVATARWAVAQWRPDAWATVSGPTYTA